jgi:hypothetical protein
MTTVTVWFLTVQRKPSERKAVFLKSKGSWGVVEFGTQSRKSTQVKAASASERITNSGDGEESLRRKIVEVGTRLLGSMRRVKGKP